MKIYVDADACPVKDEAIKVAARYQLHTFIVSNGGMRPSQDPLITNVIVAKTPDAADDWIAEKLLPNDIVITQDIPLAARALENKAHAIGPSGKLFDDHTIGMALAMRELNQHIREANNSQTHHRGFSSRDRSTFLQALDKIIVQNQQKSAG